MSLGVLAILAKLGLAMSLQPLEIVQYRFFFGALLLVSWLVITNPG
ncbi:MAG: EamA/RhaT family transporter, partial [Desulfovibrio sp.]